MRTKCAVDLLSYVAVQRLNQKPATLKTFCLMKRIPAGEREQDSLTHSSPASVRKCKRSRAAYGDQNSVDVTLPRRGHVRLGTAIKYSFMGTCKGLLGGNEFLICMSQSRKKNMNESQQKKAAVFIIPFQYDEAEKSVRSTARLLF